MRSIKLMPGGLSKVVVPLHLRRERRPRSTRFVTQSHALGRPMANPMTLVVAAAVAVAVYLLGSRLSH